MIPVHIVGQQPSGRLWGLSWCAASSCPKAPCVLRSVTARHAHPLTREVAVNRKQALTERYPACGSEYRRGGTYRCQQTGRKDKARPPRTPPVVAYGTFLVALAITLIFSPTAEALSPISEGECQKTVEQFCQAWMHQRYEVMYQALSKQAAGKMPEKKFADTYGKDRATSARLIQCTPKGPAVETGNTVAVKANLKFDKEIPPRMVSGVHTFNLVREGHAWKIDYIVSPLKVPSSFTSPGGSHPGQ
jgi:hypothetical protein